MVLLPTWLSCQLDKRGNYATGQRHIQYRYSNGSSRRWHPYASVPTDTSSCAQSKHIYYLPGIAEHSLLEIIDPAHMRGGRNTFVWNQQSNESVLHTMGAPIIYTKSVFSTPTQNLRKFIQGVFPPCFSMKRRQLLMEKRNLISPVSELVQTLSSLPDI